jgi:hypothetical protein
MESKLLEIFYDMSAFYGEKTNYTRLRQGYICNFTQKGYLIGFGQENISQPLSFLSSSCWEDFSLLFLFSITHLSLSLSPIFLKFLSTKESCYVRLLQDLLSLEAWVCCCLYFLLFSSLDLIKKLGFLCEVMIMFEVGGSLWMLAT